MDVTRVQPAPLSAVAERAQRVAGTAFCGLFLLRDEDRRLYLVASSGSLERVSSPTLVMGEGVTGLAAQQARSLVSDDITVDQRSAAGQVDLALGTRAFAAVPLRAGNAVLGVMTAGSPDPGYFTAERLAVLEAFAEQAAEALQAGERASKLEALLAAAARLVRAETEEAIIAALAGEVRRVLGADRSVAVYLLRGDQRVPAYADGPAREAILAQPPRPRDTGMTGYALRTRQPYRLDDAARDTIAQPVPGAPGNPGAALALPLVTATLEVGVLVCSRQARAPFTDEEVLAGRLFAGWAALAIESARLRTHDRRSARLDGALLAIRTAEHELNNQLALSAGYAELLAADSRLPPDLRALAVEAYTAAQNAAALLQRMRHLSRLEEKDWGASVLPTIDLERSI